jgi:hypothetical protein
MVKKEVCEHCYQQRYLSWGKDTSTTHFEIEWKNKILFCMVRKGLLGIRQGHYKEDMAGIAKAFAALPAADCPYILEHVINAQ